MEVIIEDVNDSPPAFSLRRVQIFILESYHLHTTLYIAHATDPDITPSAHLRYGLSLNDNGLFGINSISGEIYLIGRLDYETQRLHQLLINVFDATNLTANLSLYVEIQDVNDNSPLFERKEYYVAVNEGARYNSKVKIDIKTIFNFEFFREAFYHV